MSAWLHRLRALDPSDMPRIQSPLYPKYNSGCVAPQALALESGLGDKGDLGQGISPEIRPAAAPLDQQIRVVEEDLAAEGTTLGRVLAAMRPKRRKRSQAQVREARWRRAYLSDFAARPDAPLMPCACGDAVFFQLVGDHRWRCRSCERVTARARVRWRVLDPALVEAVRQIREAYPGAVVAEVRARRQP